MCAVISRVVIRPIAGDRHVSGAVDGDVVHIARLDGAVRLAALCRRGIRRTGSIGRAAQPQGALQRRLRRGVRVNQGGNFLGGLVGGGGGLDAVELGLVLVGHEAVILAGPGGGGVTEVGLDGGGRGPGVITTLDDGQGLGPSQGAGGGKLGDF